LAELQLHSRKPRQQSSHIALHWTWTFPIVGKSAIANSENAESKPDAHIGANFCKTIATTGFTAFDALRHSLARYLRNTLRTVLITFLPDRSDHEKIKSAI
jgi:hypothetical protein